MRAPRPGARRPLGLVAGLLTVLTAASACVQLPDTGPVETTADRPITQTGADSEFRPRGPVPGDSALSIVDKFLIAMTATPVRTEPALRFLSADAQPTWEPTKVITYVQENRAVDGTDVLVTLTGARLVDERGQWRGRIGNGSRTLRFRMTQEDGQWRIAQAPDALVVPADWFRDRGFRAATVYYFDPTARILEPEPVFVPRADQQATVLVQALMAGPGPRLADVARTFVPAGLTPGLSVPVSADGVASITLQGEGQITPQSAQLMVDQFAWTLKQDLTVSSFTITIGDEPLTLENGSSQFSVGLGPEYDPTDVESSSLLFAVRDGFLESGSSEGTAPVGGPFGGPEPYGIVDVAVSLKADQAAVVAAGGTALFRGPVTQAGDVGTQLADATDLLRPAWDFADRLWIVDRAADGARVSVVDTRGDGIPRPVDVPGISGADVKRFLVSRDGSRLVAVIHGRRADSLWVSRILHDNQGGVVGASRARALSWTTGDVRRIRDIGWRTPTSVAALHQLTPDVVQISSVPVDGSPGRETALAQRVRARALVTSPVPDQALFTLTARGTLANPTGAGDNLSTTLTGVTSVQYAG